MLLGLLAGALAGVLVIGAVLLYVPLMPSATPAASASAAAPSATPAAPAVSPSGDVASPAPTSGPSVVPSTPPVQTPMPTGDTAALFWIGQPAPDLVLPLLGGGAVDLSGLRGKPVWINFMASWCPPCLDELPLMAGFATRYAGTGLVIIAVDVHEDEATAAAFAKMVSIPFDVALDADGAAQGAWGANALPTHFWIDADGIVRDGALGGLGPDLMAAGLGTILPGVTVTP